MPSKRRELDRYLTDAWATQQLEKHVQLEGNILELCSGEGDIANALRGSLGENGNRITRIYTNDIDPLMNAGYHYDATNPIVYNPNGQFPCLPPIDWHVTNPPFSEAAKIIPLAYEHARVGIAMLLRLSYLEPCTKSKNSKFVKRGFWLAQHPPTDLLVLPRYSYTNDGKTDSVTCAWMVWDKRVERTYTMENTIDYFDGRSPVNFGIRRQRIICIPDDRSNGNG